LELAAIYGHLGLEQEARAALKTFNELRAKAGMIEPYTLQQIGLWGFKERKDVERWREGLRRAGLPSGREPVAAAEDLIYQTDKGPEVKGATTIDVVTAKALFDRGVTFVDVRDKSDFARGYIPGSVNLEAYSAFSKIDLSKIIRKDDEVVIYCYGKT
jgi:hypothetical protein